RRPAAWAAQWRPRTCNEMSHRPPGAAPDSEHPADDPQRIASALDAACRDEALPAQLRELLCRARDALSATASDAEDAHLRYRALFDAVPDPVSILDESGIVLDLNKAG